MSLLKSKLEYLTKVSLERKIKTKWFLIANIILAVIIVGIINIDNVIKIFGGDFNETTKIYIIDNASSYDILTDQIKNSSKSILETNFEISKYDKSIQDVKKEINKDNNIIAIIQTVALEYFFIQGPPFL